MTNQIHYTKLPILSFFCSLGVLGGKKTKRTQNVIPAKAGTQINLDKRTHFFSQLWSLVTGIKITKQTQNISFPIKYRRLQKKQTQTGAKRKSRCTSGNEANSCPFLTNISVICEPIGFKFVQNKLTGSIRSSRTPIRDPERLYWTIKKRNEPKLNNSLIFMKTGNYETKPFRCDCLGSILTEPQHLNFFLRPGMMPSLKV
jgi:hypothetical protein